MAPATKKRPPLEIEPGEGVAHELKESPEDEIREGSEEQEGEDYGSKRHSRKRSSKGAKRTKAPMDGEGCGCGAKGRKAKASCDGDCGMKKGRNDALTPQEYLAACELGIQNRSRTYIRARLDAAMSLTPSSIRNDLKCGNGSISPGEKCHKGQATKAAKGKKAADPNKFTGSNEYITAPRGTTGRGYIRTRIGEGAKIGSQIFGLMGAAEGALVGAGSAPGNRLAGAIGGAIGGGVRGLVQGAAIGGTTGAIVGAAEKSAGVRARRTEFYRRKRYGDSVWAAGFAPAGGK